MSTDPRRPDRERELAEALRRRADRARLIPSSLGEVLRRARGIRRRRTAQTAGAAAAAVVVLAGLGVALGPRLGDHSAPGPATTGPSPNPATASASDPNAPTTSPHTPTTRTFTVDLRQVRAGNGPSLRIPSWYRGTLADGHGAHAVSVPRRPLWPVLDARTGRWHAMTTDPSTGQREWTTYAADGSVADQQEAAASTVAVTPDGATYAVLLKDGGLGVRLVVGGAHHWETAVGGGADYRLAGILPDGNVVVGTPASRTVVVHPDGTQEVVPGTQPAAVNPMTGQIAVAIDTRGGSGCWALVSEGGLRGPETCGEVPVGFSADGTQVVAYDATARDVARGVARIRILDGRTLRPIATFTTAPGQTMDVVDAAWTDGALAVPVRGDVNGTDTWEIGLLSTAGVTFIHATATPASAGDAAPPYSFGAGPLRAE